MIKPANLEQLPLFLTTFVDRGFADWVQRNPRAAYELAALVPIEHSAVTLRRADLAGAIAAPRPQPGSEERRRG